ncbi:MAG: CDP-alcohol phosphatidyltransferase family protein [Williamsia sp.]|nr:CDP-alcohol phosphatidyltransferase family protein [Williamsia sp.]
MKQIPNIFTLLNLMAGCLAVIFILQTGETLILINDRETVLNLPEKIVWGSVCIGIAAAIDFLDGFVARLFHASSPIGKQLDSLADVVSFGLAPGMILYQLLRMSYAQAQNGLDISIAALVPALVFPCASAYRLARFNIDPSQQTGFKGVPAPAAGLLVASLPLILFYNYYDLSRLLLNKWFLYAFIGVSSYLMVSTLPLIALKSGGSSKGRLPEITLLLIAVLSAIFLKWLAVPVVFLCYIIISLLASRQPKRS